jgi:dolichyl-phosphate beta-glucosyltransferase
LGDEPTLAVSVIVPAYNEAVRMPAMLTEMLDYLHGQSQNDATFTWEIIVVDDGSKDNTVAVAQVQRCRIAIG